MATETEVWGPKQHMRNKGMWMGSKCMSSGEFYMINQDCIVSRSAVFSSGAAKTFDEVIVNAADQTTRNAGVTYIAINFEGGNLTVQNDGRGIPIYQAEILYDVNNSIVGVQNVSDPNDPMKVNTSIVRNSANIRWNPQIICEQPLSGTNLSKRKFHITGGVNGAGLKIVNYLSRYFSIVTVDNSRRLRSYPGWSRGAKRYSSI
jgi:DNA topoisomerase-2